VEDNSAVYQLTAILEPFEPKVIYQEIAINFPGEGNQGRHHFLMRPDRIDQVKTHVKRHIRCEDVVVDDTDSRN